MSVGLALPDPQSVTLARVPEIIAQVRNLRGEIEQNADGDTALELHRRLEALRKYLADKEASAAVEAESRRTEMLIGRLLGPAEHGGDRKSDQVTTCHLNGGLNEAERRRFRLLAQHAEAVEELLAQGVTKRAALLRAVGALPEPEYGYCPTCGHRLRKDRPRTVKGKGT